jgi:hypothetical protein
MLVKAPPVTTELVSDRIVDSFVQHRFEVRDEKAEEVVRKVRMGLRHHHGEALSPRVVRRREGDRQEEDPSPQRSEHSQLIEPFPEELGSAPPAFAELVVLTPLRHSLFSPSMRLSLGDAACKIEDTTQKFPAALVSGKRSRKQQSEVISFPFAPGTSRFSSGLSPLSRKMPNPSVATELPIEVLSWAKEYAVDFDSEALAALNTLLGAARKLSSEQLLLLLELLRAYADQRVFDNAKRNSEKYTAEWKSLARILKKAVPIATRLMSELEPEFVDSLQKAADNAESYSKVAVEAEVGDAMGRSFSGTTYFLVFATELLTAITGRPHYRELADLLSCIATATPGCRRSKQELSEGGIGKDVVRFKKREYDFMDQSRARGSIEQIASQEIDAWHSAEKALRNAPKKSPFREPASSVEEKKPDPTPAESITAAEGENSDQD